VTDSRKAKQDRMRAAAGRRSAEDAPAAGRTAMRSKPVRITLDLSPEDYRALTAWTTATAAAVDVARVTQAEAVRAMIRATTQDNMVGDIVISMIMETRDQ
jgi:hypothetical protein